MGDIRIGTSGWNYPSGKGTWNGIFYPIAPGRRTRKAGGFDELRFYAEHFDTVEINSTFYGVPAPAAARGWAERTPPGFEFSLKLYQKFTHPDMFLKTTGQDPWSLGQQDVDQFRQAIDPLAAAGKLGALLAQFPASFKNEPDTRAYLEWLLERFKDYQVAVELRHRSWSDRPVETLQLLDAFGGAWAQIDEPKFRFSIRQNLLPNARTFYYLRLHGRNADQWWKHEKSEDRYNYLYSADELRPFAAAANGSVERGQEGVPLCEQPFLGEVGRQRGHPEGGSRSAAAGGVHAGDGRALSGPEGPRQTATGASSPRALLRHP